MIRIFAVIMNMSHIGNIINKVFRNWIIRSVQFLIAAFIFSLPMQALVIRGDVYGGGKFGKVGTEVAHSTTDVEIGRASCRERV